MRARPRSERIRSIVLPTSADDTTLSVRFIVAPYSAVPGAGTFSSHAAVIPTVSAAITMAFQSGQAVAVLLGQRLIGAKQF
jgi:hypothetical protein